MSNPEEKLSQAAQALRESPIHRDVLDRAEAAVLARVARRRYSLARPILLGTAGLATLAVTALVALPGRAAAADLLRIVGNGDRGLRHIRYYTRLPDGTRHVTMEMYTQAGRRRMIFENETIVFDGEAVTSIFPRTAKSAAYATVERQPSDGTIPAYEGSARRLVAEKAPGARITVRHGAFDTYDLDREEDGTHVHLTLAVDPRTDRPLALRSVTVGQPDLDIDWEYPAPNPALFRADIPRGIPVYDVNAQRNAVLTGIGRTGRRAIVGDETVELTGLWVDEDGLACAVTKANYPFPRVYGIGIDRATPPGPSSPWTPDAVQRPSTWRGTAVQLIMKNDGHYRPQHYPDRVSVQIPVFHDLKLVGYARFDDVPVNRTFSVLRLLRPFDVPFWEPPRTGPGTRTVPANSSP